MMKTKKRDIWSIISWIILFALILYFVYPLVMLLREAVYEDGQFTIAGFRKFFAKSYYYKTILNSFKVAIGVMVCALLVGVPFSYFYTFYRLRGKKILFVLCLLATMSAPFIGAYSWVLLLGRSGAITTFLKTYLGIKLGDIYGFNGILLCLTLKLFPLVVIYMNGAFRNIDNSLIEAAENYGCKGVKRLVTIIMALSMPTMLAAALLVFMRAFADFGTPLLIGEGFKTFPVLIYEAFLGENGQDFNFASSVSVIAIVITGAVFLFQKFVTSQFQFSVNAINKIDPKTPRGLFGILIHLYCYLLVFIALLPNIYIIYMSFRKFNNSVMLDGYSLDNYVMAVKKQLARSVKNTLIISFVALALIVVIAVIIAYLVVRRSSFLNHTIDTISMLPYIMPGAVIGISLIVGFNRKPFQLTGTIFIMIIALVIRRMPFTSRSATAAMMQIPMSTEEAALSLGASKIKTFIKVTVPMMYNGIVSGAVLSFASIITEMSSTVLLYNSRTITLTIGTYTSIVRGMTGVAAAFSAITTVFTVLCLVVYLFITNEEDVSM